MGDSAALLPLLPLDGGILVTVPLAMLTLRPACCCLCGPTILWTGTTPFEVSTVYERTCLDCCFLPLPLPLLPLLPLLPTNRKLLPPPDLVDLDRPFLVVAFAVLVAEVGEVGAVIRLSAAAAVGWTFFEELPPLPDLLRLLLPLRRSAGRGEEWTFCACFLCSARALRCLSLRAVVPVFATLRGLSLSRD